MAEDQAYFLTVDWCKKGCRGVFCDAQGRAYRKDSESHLHREMREILDVFWLVLDPESTLLTVGQLSEYRYWFPLKEYSSQFGVALKECDVPIRVAPEAKGASNETDRRTENTVLQVASALGTVEGGVQTGPH